MILPIVVYGHKALGQAATPVAANEVTSKSVQELITDMIQTLVAAGGVGLSANQVNRPEAVIVVAIDGDAVPLINPRITERSGTQTSDEGCMSTPEVYSKVERSSKITVKALSSKGDDVEMVAEGIVANIIQHEIDHLDGKLFIERLSPANRKALDPELKHLVEFFPDHTISATALGANALVRGVKMRVEDNSNTENTQNTETVGA